MSVADVSATGFYFWFFRCVFSIAALPSQRVMKVG
jgi:hypothetical protein